MATIVFGAVLVAWGAAALLRFARMYDLDSRFQRWRRWGKSPFSLVPTGAYFSPTPPSHHLALLIRGFPRSTDFRVTGRSGSTRHHVGSCTQSGTRQNSAIARVGRRAEICCKRSTR